MKENLLERIKFICDDNCTVQNVQKIQLIYPKLVILT